MRALDRAYADFAPECIDLPMLVPAARMLFRLWTAVRPAFLLALARPSAAPLRGSTQR
jgi:hypothetical protein